jgi:hypothetical protein
MQSTRMQRLLLFSSSSPRIRIMSALCLINHLTHVAVVRDYQHRVRHLRRDRAYVSSMRTAHAFTDIHTPYMYSYDIIALVQAIRNKAGSLYVHSRPCVSYYVAAKKPDILSIFYIIHHSNPSAHYTLYVYDDMDCAHKTKT